jgi:hypothetical protein
VLRTLGPGAKAPLGLLGAENNGFGDHLGALSPILRIADPERMDGFVDQCAQPGVRERADVDDYPLVLLIAPAASRPGDRLERDGEPSDSANACSVASKCA